MQEPILSPTTAKRIYSTKGILIGSLLAGPLVAGYMMSSNCSALELKNRTRIWIISIISFICITALAIFLPESVPAFVFIFANAALGYYLAQYLQGKDIEQHISNGGPMYSGWRSAGIALIFTVVFILIALLAFLLADLSAGKF